MIAVESRREQRRAGARNGEQRRAVQGEQRRAEKSNEEE